MSTRLYKAISEKGTHKVGNLNTRWAEHVANGAIALEDIENYTQVEIAGRDAEGNLTCQPLKAVTNESYLVTTIEEEQLMNLGGYQETYVDFFNEKGEVVRLTRQRSGVRFETSAFTLNTGVTAVERGLVAHFDPTSKTYILSKKDSAHASYATAVKKFTVVDEDSDFGYGLDVKTIMLEVQ